MIEIKTVTGDLLARLETTTMEGMDLSGATLREVALEDASLRRANLANSNIELGRFARADLKGVNLTHADLNAANLDEANLENADLTHTILTGASFRGANLVGADLTGADWHGAHFDGAKYDRRTKWPDGVDPGHHNAVQVVEDGGSGSPEKRAMKLMQSRRIDDAVAVLAAALHDAPRNPKLHHLLGCAYAMRNDHDRAWVHFQESLSNDGDNASTHFDLAVLYDRRGFHSLAKEQLEIVLRLQPNHEKGERMLAEVRGRAAR